MPIKKKINRQKSFWEDKQQAGDIEPEKVSESISKKILISARTTISANYTKTGFIKDIFDDNFESNVRYITNNINQSDGYIYLDLRKIVRIAGGALSTYLAIQGGAGDDNYLYYALETSTDGNTWTTHDSVEYLHFGNAGLEIWQDSAIPEGTQARWVRIVFKARSDNATLANKTFTFYNLGLFL
jgi:hypothetical protein